MAVAPAIEPALDAVVRAFFATQESEDIAGYLALWSRTVRAPSPVMLKFVFDSGNDRYSDISILRVDTSGAVTRVRVAATRDRTAHAAGGLGPATHSRYVASLLMVKEDGEWRLVGEGSAVDDLAGELLAAPTAEARETLLRESPTLVTRQLVDAISRRATDLIRDRHYAEAQTVFERALEIARRVGDRKVEGEALQNLANTFYFQRNFPARSSCNEQRLAIERERKDPEAIAASLVGAGNVRYSLADDWLAVALSRGAGAPGAAPDHTAGSINLISTGNVSYLLGDYPAAIADYRRSRELYRELATMPAASRWRGWAASTWRKGTWPRPSRHSQACWPMARRGTTARAGSALMSLGDVHLRLGNLSAARSALEESARHFEAPATAPIWVAPGSRSG